MVDDWSIRLTEYLVADQGVTVQQNAGLVMKKKKFKWSCLKTWGSSIGTHLPKVFCGIYS